MSAFPLKFVLFLFVMILFRFHVRFQRIFGALVLRWWRFFYRLVGSYSNLRGIITVHLIVSSGRLCSEPV